MFIRAVYESPALTAELQALIPAGMPLTAHRYRARSPPATWIPWRRRPAVGRAGGGPPPARPMASSAATSLPTASGPPAGSLGRGSQAPWTPPLAGSNAGAEPAGRGYQGATRDKALSSPALPIAGCAVGRDEPVCRIRQDLHRHHLDLPPAQARQGPPRPLPRRHPQPRRAGRAGVHRLHPHRRQPHLHLDLRHPAAQLLPRPHRRPSLHLHHPADVLHPPGPENDRGRGRAEPRRVPPAAQGALPGGLQRKGPARVLRPDHH
jgi:hypothetical protein